MKCVKFLGMALVLAAAGLAQGADVKFRVDQKLLSYEQESEKTEANGASNTVKTTTVDTNPLLNTELSIYIDSCRLTYSPYGGALGFSHFFQKELEAGVVFATNSTKVDEPKNEESDMTLGVFGIYYVGMGNAEMEFDFGLTMGSSKSDNGTTKTNSKSTSIPLGFTYFRPMAENVFYGFGINYTVANAKDSETDEKTTTNTLGIDLASLKVTF